MAARLARAQVFPVKMVLWAMAPMTGRDDAIFEHGFFEHEREVHGRRPGAPCHTRHLTRDIAARRRAAGDQPRSPLVSAKQLLTRQGPGGGTVGSSSPKETVSDVGQAPWVPQAWSRSLDAAGLTCGVKSLHADQRSGMETCAGLRPRVCQRVNGSLDCREDRLRFVKFVGNAWRPVDRHSKRIALLFVAGRTAPYLGPLSRPLLITEESLDTMSTHKNLLTACLAAVFALGLAACSSSDSPAPAEPPPPADAGIEDVRTAAMAAATAAAAAATAAEAAVTAQDDNQAADPGSYAVAQNAATRARAAADAAQAASAAAAAATTTAGRAGTTRHSGGKAGRGRGRAGRTP